MLKQLVPKKIFSNFKNIERMQRFLCYFKNNFIAPNLYPVAIAALAYMCGIWWQASTHSWPIVTIIASSIFTLVIAISRHARHTLLPMAIVAPLAFSIGCIRYQQSVHTHTAAQKSINEYKGNIRGEITDILYTGNERFPRRITIAKAQFYSKTINPSSQSHALFIYTGYKPWFHIGDIINIHDAHIKTNYEQNFSEYLMKEGATATVFSKSEALRLTYRPNFSFWRSMHTYRRKLLFRCKKKMLARTFIYFASIFLGEPAVKKNTSALKQQMQHWGIVHYLARSGLHVVIFIAIWQLLLRLLPLPYILKELLLMLLLLVYACMSWPSIPFYRALYTFLIMRSCNMQHVRTYYIPVLATISLCFLLFNPILMFSLDFQLSFGITFALAWLNEIKAKSYTRK